MCNASLALCRGYVNKSYLSLFLKTAATSAHKGTIPLRLLLTTKATALAATSLSWTRSDKPAREPVIKEKREMFRYNV